MPTSCGIRISGFPISKALLKSQNPPIITIIAVSNPMYLI
jgi:hypothetical protein